MFSHSQGNDTRSHSPLVCLPSQGHKVGTFLLYRHKLLKEGPKRFKKDGLNSLKYKIVKVQKESFYTRISVDINENEIMQVCVKLSHIVETIQC